MSSTSALWCDFSLLSGIKMLTIFWISAVKCNICKHLWNQQVFSVVFTTPSLQNRAGAGRLSSPQQLPVMVISHSFSNTHTHTPRPMHICTESATHTLPHLHRFAHLNTLVLFSPTLLFFDNTTSSLSASRSAPLSVLQRESLLWAIQKLSGTRLVVESLQGPLLYNLHSLYRTSISVEGIPLWKHRGSSWNKAIWCFVANVSEVMDTVWKATTVWVKWQS